MDYRAESLKLHAQLQGKIAIDSKIKLDSMDSLSLAYTPGVAEPCMAIYNDYNKSFDLTARGNLIAVITDGTAVLGLGDIGPEAAMPVMEGKCAIFKEFGGVQAFPLCIKSKDVDEIVRTVYLLSGSFGGINLEDISAPRCFEIERRLKLLCDVPVFHDDQHGTAIVAGAALINSLKLAGKQLQDANIVINGAGAAGIAIAKFLLILGAKHIIMCDKVGILYDGMSNLPAGREEIVQLTNLDKKSGTLADAMAGADVFIGVSVKDCVTVDMVKSMADKPILFPLANPDPEIAVDLAKQAGVFVLGTGRSDYPNQINNSLVFPGIFRGALDVRASDINNDMRIAAAYAIADSVPDHQLSTDNILPKTFDKSVHSKVAHAVSQAAIQSKVNRK